MIGLGVALLLGVFSVVAAGSIKMAAAIFNEGYHLTSGLFYLLGGHPYFNLNDPPLIAAFSAPSLLFTHPVVILPPSR